MAMSSSSSSSGATPNINVTPLIDVLLVLLIIFMVITPLKPHKFEAKVPAEPKPEDQLSNPKPNPLTLVVTISKGVTGNDTKVSLNNEDMGNISDLSGLTTKLSQTFKDRTQNNVLREGTNEIEKTLFIKSPRSVKYGAVVNVIDAVKQAGAQPIGLQIDDLSE